ncbi:MAG: DUF3159 domain-containing protein [Pseudonocardiales bacterium]
MPETEDPKHSHDTEAPAGSESIASAAPEPRIDLRETYRKQMLDGIGGWTGTVITAIPPVVFVIVNSIADLRPAIIAAVGAAVALTVYRLIRRQSIQQALTGLFAVVVAAVIAGRTGEARGYFLLGIWSSFAYAAAFAVSVLVRRPVVGLMWEFLEPMPGVDGVPWHKRKALLRAYDIATLAATVVFLARGVVQLTLFRHNATGWLAFARISMGYPLYIAAVGFGFWIVSRTRRRLATATDAA